MIYRLQVWLPFEIVLLPKTLAPLRLQVGEFVVTMFPPYRSALREAHLAEGSEVSPVEVSALLRQENDSYPAGPPTLDGLEAVSANALRADVSGEFDGLDGNDRIALNAVAFGAANRLLVGMRFIARASFAHPIGPTGSIWRGRILNAAVPRQTVLCIPVVGSWRAEG
jgi:hypothetical protein